MLSTLNTVSIANTKQHLKFIKRETDNIIIQIVSCIVCFYICIRTFIVFRSYLQSKDRSINVARQKTGAEERKTADMTHNEDTPTPLRLRLF